MYMTVLKMDRNSLLNASNPLNINSSNSVHKWLTAQQDCHRADDKILYRIINKNDEIYMYIQSKTKFNINNIENVGFIFLKEMNISISSTGTYTFDIQTFPNKTIQNNKRYFIKDINERYLWLQKQFNKFNINLLECREYSQNNIIFDKDSIKNISTSTFSGIIKINDINKANELIENGLGRFKNYGLGLLLVKNF